MPTIRVSRCIIFQFTVLNTAGQPDTTTSATAASSNPGALRVVINPSNPREAAAVALAVPVNPVAVATISAFGHAAQQAFDLAAAPDLSQVTLGTVPSTDQEVPSWAQ